MRRYDGRAFPLRRIAQGLGLAALAACAAPAAPEPVSVRVPEAKAWTGQRLTFFVDLRSAGSFGGATFFTLPQVPGSVVMKSGNPVVSSETIDGESWFVQTHRFALFSQAEGAVAMPAFPVRYGTRDGFTGPVEQVEAQVPAFEVTIERPPDTGSAGFLVTTTSLEIDESWDPDPAVQVEVGAVFKRTLAQQVEGLSGMALAPAPTDAPAGVKVYPGKPGVTDNTQRGAFSGRRVETVTYQIEAAGDHVLPGIRYHWWNPDTETLETTALPAVTVSATAPPAPPAPRSPLRWLPPILVVALLACAVVLRRYLHSLAEQLATIVNPPDRRCARRFLHACRHDDATAAARTWAEWTRLNPRFVPTGDLKLRLKDLYRHLYRPASANEPWQGSELARAFRLYHGAATVKPTTGPLPPLNP